MSEKSGSQKALKVISIILVVLAALAALFGLFMLAASTLPALVDVAKESGAVTDADSMDLATFTMVALSLGVVSFISGIVYLVIGILGIRAANNPTKTSAFFVLCIIGTVLSVLGLIQSIIQATVSPQDVVMLIAVVACLVLCVKIRKETQA